MNPYYPENEQFIEAPEPVEPGAGTSPIWKGFLLLLILAVLVLGIGGYYFYDKSGELTAMLFEKGKPQLMSYLTEKNTKEDRENFEKTYDAMVRKIKEDGIIKFINEHEKSYNILQEIIADREISPEEVYLWINEWDRETGKPRSLEQGEIQGDEVKPLDQETAPLVEPQGN